MKPQPHAPLSPLGHELGAMIFVCRVSAIWWYWFVAAERSDAGRFIVHADQELPAFLELESAINTHRHILAYRPNRGPKPDEALGNYR
jgi:hypothetical protein